MRGLLILAMTLAAFYARPIWIDSEDRVIRDEQNRHVIFHGVNVVEKLAPYIPD